MCDSDLTDKEWGLIEPILPRQRGPGRPRADDRKTINGILYVLKRGCRWKDLPRDYGGYSTCRERLVHWQRQKVWVKVFRVLLGQLGKRGRLKMSHGSIDASFAPAKKGGPKLARRARAKEPSTNWPSTNAGRR